MRFTKLISIQINHRSIRVNYKVLKEWREEKKVLLIIICAAYIKGGSIWIYANFCDKAKQLLTEQHKHFFVVVINLLMMIDWCVVLHTNNMYSEPQLLAQTFVITKYGKNEKKNIEIYHY